MNKTFRILISIAFMIGVVSSFGGCAESLLSCSAPIGTTEYNMCSAKNGSREAQYVVGLAAFEEGDMDEAIKWLERAAEPDTGMRQVYMPPVGGQGVGTIETLPQGNKHPGNKDAQRLLAKIYLGGMGIEADEKKANKYSSLARGAMWIN